MAPFLQWLTDRWATKKEDDAAIAEEHEEERRAGDEPRESQADIVGEAFDKSPPP